MITQYPHILKLYLSTSAPSLVDGEWVFGATSDIELACRAEANTKGSIMATASGDTVNYSYTVYLPKMDINIPVGTDCKLKLSDIVEYPLKVKWNENGQLNSRIWL